MKEILQNFESYAKEFICDEKNFFNVSPRIILGPLVLIVHKYFRRVFRSQDDEELILDDLIEKLNNKEKIFFEFEFVPAEINCSKLSISGVTGLLIDNQPTNVSLARKLLNKNTTIREKKLKPNDIKGTRKKESI